MVDGRRRERKRERPSGDSWFYWSQGSHKHFLYLCRYKKLEFTWQLRGYRIVWRVIQSNFWIYSGHKKNAAGHVHTMSWHPEYKRTGSRSSKSQRTEECPCGRRQFSSAIWVQKLQQPLINVFCFFFFHLGTGLHKEQVQCWNQAVWQQIISLSKMPNWNKFCHTSERNQLGWCEILKLFIRQRRCVLVC